MESFFNSLLLNFFKVLKKFTVFTGRSERVEFWMFMLFNLIAGIVFSILVNIPLIGKLFYFICILYYVAIIIPTLAVAARRLHDTEKTGLLLILLLIPAVGAVIILILCALEGTPGENKYGPDPRYET